MAISKRQTPTGKTRWVARYRDHAGKEHAKTFTTQKQAKAFLQEQQRAIRRGEWVDEKTVPTISEYWPVWAATATTPGTVSAREQTRKNLGDLEGMQITKITPSVLRAWVSQLRTGRDWIPGCTGLAENTVRTHWSQLSGCFNSAVEDGIITASPMARVKLGKSPGQGVKPAKIPDLESVQRAIKLLDSTGRDTQATMIILAASTGMRASEVCGLRWENVDRRKAVVHIVEQAASAHTRNRGELVGEERWAKRLKTPTSYRDVPLPASTLVRLREHRLRHPAAPGEPMFISPVGKIWNTKTLGMVMQKVGIRFHDLRHLYASNLIRQGLGVKAVQEMLGHSSASITLDVYTHLWADETDRARVAADDLVRTFCGLGEESSGSSGAV